MNRREFIQTLTASTLLPVFAPKTFANSLISESTQAMAPIADRVLVILQMNGGNDGLNTVIPMDQYSTLSLARPNILMPDTKPLPLGSSQTALHPSLSFFKELYDNKKLCIVQNVGYENPDFSHFRSSDIWNTAANSNEVFDTGWLGRLVNHWYPSFPSGYPNSTLTDPAAITLNSVVADSFQGDQVNISESVTSSFSGSLTSLVGLSNSNQPIGNLGKELSFLRQQQASANAYSSVIVNAWNAGKNNNTYTNSPSGGSGSQLGKQLKIVARLLSGGLKTKIFWVQMSGFDTHANQVSSSDKSTGKHALLLQEIGVAVKEFLSDLTAQGLENRVLMMTMSEFGRRIVSNASNGTDHGTAAPHFLIGTGVNPTIIGANPIIKADVKSWENLPYSIHYRSLYDSVLQGWFGLTAAESEKVLLHAPTPINAITALEKGGVALRGIPQFHMKPTPDGYVWININSNLGSQNESYLIRIYNVNGQEIFKSKSELNQSPQLINATSPLSSGTYLIQVQGKKGSGSFKWVVP